MNPICPNCGALVRSGASFCGTCRQPLAPSSALAPGRSSSPASGWSTPSTATLWAADGRQYPLAAPVTRIGREPTNDIPLPDARISGYHAEIKQGASGYILRDLGSTNGTYVNGQRISGDRPLSDGDVIMIGGTRLTFRHLSGAPGRAGPSPRTQAMDPADVQAMLSGSPQIQPQPPPPTPWSAGKPGVPAPLPSSPPQSMTAQPPSSTPSGGFWANLTAPNAVGPILFEPTEDREPPPTDISRVLVTLAVTLAFLGVTGIFIAAMVAMAVVLLCVGAAALLFVVPFLFMPLKMLFDAVMGWLGREKEVTVVRFRVEDEKSGQPVDVVLMRKLGRGGGLHQGDRVQVWGRVTGNTLYAHKVRLESSGAIIRARKPWPLWIGILALAGVIGSLIYLAVALELIQF